MQPNHVGGDTNIRIRVPVGGIELTKGHKGEATVRIRTPGGKEIEGTAEIVKDPKTGKTTADVIIPLRPHHEKGKYIVEEVVAREEFPQSTQTPTASKPSQSTQIKTTSERLIERTFDVE